jgi:hypothetical protein
LPVAFHCGFPEEPLSRGISEAATNLVSESTGGS